jgi:hypothetical protein
MDGTNNEHPRAKVSVAACWLWPFSYCFLQTGCYLLNFSEFCHTGPSAVTKRTHAHYEILLVLKHVEVILILSHSKLQLHLFIVHKKYRSIICLLPYTCESVFIMHMCIVVKFFC